MTSVRVCSLMLAALVVPSLCSAQAPERRTAVEGTAGYAAFVDESAIEHTVIGAGVRRYLTRRFAIGAEATYMIGPHEDRDFFLNGNLWFDFVSNRRVTPYLVVGGGLMVHQPEFDFLGGPYYEGSFTGGGGVRFNVNDRWYVAPEARIGWEPHIRITGTVGYRLGR